MESRTNVKRFPVDWAAVLALLVYFIAFTGYKGSTFMSGSNMVNILRAMAISTVFGIAATITIAPDGFDMSAGTLTSCSAYVFVSAYLRLGVSLGMSIITCIFATLVMYRLTMFLILMCKIPGVLATCTLMFVHQGIGQWYIDGDTTSVGMKTSQGVMPTRTAPSESFSAIGCAPRIVIIVLGCVLVAYLSLDFTKYDRYLYAMGGSKKTARLSGTNVKKYRYLVGVITAIFIAVDDILVASEGSSAQVVCYDNYPMPSLAAVFVGHTIGGAGKPNALGTIVGVVLVSTLESGLIICTVPFYVLLTVEGAVLALTLIVAYASRRED